MKEWFVRLGVPAEKVIELGWWEDTIINPSDLSHRLVPFHKVNTGGSSASLSSDPSTTSDAGRLHLTCTPAQHNSGRSLFRRNSTLWATWSLKYDLPSGETFRCFFGG
jgi:N-acyl-phosphatidylethanolamine-hydrolysing phospholipase D